MIRVLVVDDSRAGRELMARVIDTEPGLELTGLGDGGEKAVRLAQELGPDVITMDLHMAQREGYEAIRQIMRMCPTRIVVVGHRDDREEIDMSLRAIEMGALMLVRRPFGPGSPAYAEVALALVRAIKAMAEVRVVRRWGDVRRAPGAGAAPRRRLVVIGASTGGPSGLRDILAQLPPRFALPVVIVQHLAAGFTRGMAEWLAAASGYPVVVANAVETLHGGRAYLVPDGCQPAIGADLSCRLLQGAPEHGMCPSVSHLFRSVDPELRPATIAVLLSGMGKDGAAELRQLREQGAFTIAQDRASSAVYGMPGEALRLDAAMQVLEPPEIGKLLQRLAADPSLSNVFPN